MTQVPGASEHLAAVDSATARLLATIGRLQETDMAAATVLPGWTRAHVVAHMALNAEGLAGAVDGLARGERVPVYGSDEERDTAIEDLATQPADGIVQRLRVGARAFSDAVRRVPDDGWSGSVDRLPSGPTFPALEVLLMREREVEIHHADLGAGFAHTEWSRTFVESLLDQVCRDRAASGPFTVAPTDHGREWEVGASGGPTVSGPAADLGWWLVGRGASTALACDEGELPDIGPWRRPPPRH